MTKEEVIEILERFVIGAKPCSQREIVDACASAYTMLKEQPSLPSDIDEVAWEYFIKTYGIDNLAISEDIKRAVKFGAEWMAGQGVKASASVGYYNQCGLSILTEPSIKKLGFKEGDVLEITIKKK